MLGIVRHFLAQRRKVRVLEPLYEQFRSTATSANVEQKFEELMAHDSFLKTARADNDGSWIVDLHAFPIQLAAPSDMKSMVRCLLSMASFAYASERYPKLTFELVITPALTRAPPAEREHLLVILENNAQLPSLTSNFGGMAMAHFFGMITDGLSSDEAVAMLRGSVTWSASVPIEHFKDFIHERHKPLLPALRTVA